jgi:hexosaminidase
MMLFIDLQAWLNTPVDKFTHSLYGLCVCVCRLYYWLVSPIIMTSMRGLFLCLLAVVVCQLAQVSALWPWPQLAELGTSQLTLDPNFSFVNSQGSARLTRGIARYQALIQGSSGAKLSAGATTGATLSSCSVLIAKVYATEDEEYKTLAPGVDESYMLQVSADGSCSISATNVWGALYGMETFSQLLTRSTDSTTNTQTVTVNNLPVNVMDSARFSHRGMLVDTARHYLPVAELQRIVDTFPMSKLNVLHWHAVDAQSFPLSLPSAPQMVNWVALFKLGMEWQ